ncbi:MAG: adenylosuccinate synthase [Cytophagaceae bacterium]|jgi:adenylosuccinate synthase|nr:adenylosuccinate synthase [Cytophagaceae bacterium]
MAVDILLGLQWGDEGKGKVVDFLAPKYDLIARFQGGPNAGHTLEFDGHKHVLHQIPSGIFRDEQINLIGNGVVLDPVIFRKEVEALISKFKIDFKKKLFISKKTQLILPTHRLLDAAHEASKGNNKIGSTLKGIGPTYSDKIGRLGIRIGDILAPDFKERYRSLVNAHESQLKFYKFEYTLEETEKAFFEAIEFLKTFNLVDSEYFINDALNKGQKVLAEGAQGSLLDIDFGSYPFVTSSNTMSAGACTGLGVPPSKIGSVYGIFKAYCTRVGSGPFPTELSDATGEFMRKEGNEFGSTTGRPRRCGWLDIPSLKYAVMLNGVTHLLMMKADVLNKFEELLVCTHYKLEDGSIVDQIPYDIVRTNVTPVYKKFKGWNQDLSDVKTFEAMPQELVDYIAFVEQQLNVPISLISIGPDRTQTIVRDSEAVIL